MQTKNFLSRFFKTGTRLVILASMLMAAFINNVKPASAATVSFDLYAVSGTTTLGTQTVTVWGYNNTGAAATQPGGPTLIVNQGDTVQIMLHNQLGESTALLFQGQDMIPDTAGAGPGGTKLYSFIANRPGTYLYEAGLLPNAQHQVAMGLYGALIVRPTVATQAYDDSSTAFNDEAVLVLSEIDPALNNRSGGPAGFDMRKYAPRYFLINGKTYPGTDVIPTAAGNTVLLRYVNAGTQYHSMALLGLHQTVIANDASPLTYSHSMVAETFGPGQTVDAIATVPLTTVDGSKFAVYDGGLMLRNSNVAGFGGMLTFLTVAGAVGGTDTTGPATSGVAFAAGTLTATVDDTATGGATIAMAEYYLDSTSDTPVSMSATDGAFDEISESVTLAVTVPAGQHTLYVRGQDSLGNWGAFSSVLVNGGDLTGPATTSPTLTPNLTNGTGTAGYLLHATGNDTSTGNSTIAAAEYFIDTLGSNGSGVAMTVNTPSPIASLDATIPAATVNTLAEGTHVISIHSRDAAGNWGNPTTVTLTVDKTGPTSSGVSAAPSPNNGTLPFNASILAVRVTVTTLSDPIVSGVRSNISAAEAFIDTVGVSGTGILLNASDGVFNNPLESGYFDIPLATIAQLSNGNHTLYIHGKDAAGNWGTTATTVILIDKTAPTLSGVAATPNPTLGAASVTLAATAADTLTTVTNAEWFTGADPGIGNGTPMTISGTGPWNLSASINVSNWNEGAYTLSVRAHDLAGNWSLPATTVLNVRSPLYFSTSGNTNPPGVGGTADDADIYFWNGTAFSRSIDVTAITNPLPNGANVDGFDRVDATHFYMSFSGAVTIVLPGPDLTVQDEDVVYYNAGAWSLFFDGSVNGIGGTDLDAISIVAGTLYFSTDNTTVPPGAGGAGDDADIYRWNGASSYTRIHDASALGWSIVNVDGFVRVDATHFYISYSADTTVPVLGAVQDEDILYYNNGVWSVYFDGTSHGLTSANLDTDAFDLP